MIGEALILAGLTGIAGGTIKKLIPHSAQRECLKTWYNVMDGAAGTKDKLEGTFTPTLIVKMPWGFRMKVRIPNGKSFEDLEKLNKELDTAYSGIVDIRKGRFEKLATVNIVTKEFDDIKFNPAYTQAKGANVILAGYDYTGEPIYVDMNTFPHVLIGGATGTGKSRCIFVILSYLVYHYGAEELELYMAQVAKKDLIHFATTENCKYYARNMAQTIKMLYERVKECERREALFERAFVEDIKEYNKKYPKKALPNAYITTDEVSFYMPDSTDSKEMKAQKAQALDYLKQLIKIGRSAGHFVILAIQKTDTENLKSTIKNQTNCKISYRQTTSQSSINIIEDTKAVGLPIREAIVYTNEYIYMKTPWIDSDIIDKSIEHRLRKLDVLLKVKASQQEAAAAEEDKKEEAENTNDTNTMGIIEE